MTTRRRSDVMPAPLALLGALSMPGGAEKPRWNGPRILGPVLISACSHRDGLKDIEQKPDGFQVQPKPCTDFVRPSASGAEAGSRGLFFEQPCNGCVDLGEPSAVTRLVKAGARSGRSTSCPLSSSLVNALLIALSPSLERLHASIAARSLARPRAAAQTCIERAPCPVAISRGLVPWRKRLPVTWS